MAAKTAKAPARSRRPKAEVLEEFSGIRKEVEGAREVADAKAAEAAARRETEVRQAVEGLSVETVVQRISGLGLEISKALSEVSARLVEEVDRLAAVREAVAIERRELERLHKIDVAATALERKKAQDKYEEDQRLLERKNKEKQEALEKDWQQREAALKDGQQELLALRKEVAEFPARLQAEVDQAVAQALQATEAKSQQEIVLLKKDAESERRLADLRVKTFEELAARQATQIAALQKQLDEAKQQVQDIALKAIEGASGAKALAHVNQIAMEQAKSRPQT